VNAGILGMQTFSKYIREAMALDPYVDARHINLSERLTIPERLVRRVMCARAWPDGFLGLRNVDLARLRQEYHAGLQAARRIRRAIDAEGVDVLHFHRQTTAYASVGLMRRVPSIVSIDATQDAVIDVARTPIERWTYGPNAARDGTILRAAFAIVSTSQWSAGCIRKRYPDCETPIHVMPPPVRTQFFNPGWIDERFMRTQAGWKPRVLFVGGDFVRKGGPELLTAWTQTGLHETATLDLVTDWPVDTSRLPGVRVIRDVVSYSSEWSELWRTADVFVMPTRSEAYGLVFSEAAAAGLPVVATMVNAVPEQVVHQQTGLLVPPMSPQALVEALRVVIGSAELRRTYGRAARARVLELSDPDEYRRKLRNLIRVAAAAPAARRLVTA
jgi:glycosyltransferase involved in cell wall biosynthesis